MTGFLFFILLSVVLHLSTAVGDPLGGCCVTPYGYSVMLKKVASTFKFFFPFLLNLHGIFIVMFTQLRGKDFWTC